MGAAPIVCGCKGSNVVEPTPVKPSLPPQHAKEHIKEDLVLTELDKDTFSDDNNNNNAGIMQTEQIVKRNQSEHSILKRYDFQTVIGEGSFSKVLRVQHKQTKEYYALKIIDKAKSLQSDTPSYDREYKILGRTNHPNVVTLFKVLHSNAKVYLVLELASGGDLFDRISSTGRYSETIAKRTLRMITRGLAYLHQQGVTHRDLKLENVLYKTPDIDSKIFLSDFGLSHLQDSTRHTGMWTTCGSAEYLAPEMLDGLEYSSKIDTWALGVVTYAVLCAHMPFMDQNRARLYQKIKSGLVSFKEELWDEISPSAKDFICKLLEVSTERRLSATAALNHTWICTC